MALSDLTAALSTLESKIASLSAEVDKPNSYSIETLSAQRAQLSDLLAARRELKRQIREDGSNLFEEQSIWLP